MKRFIRECFTENWTLKATAILLALILWLFVRGEPGVERVVTVPLDVQVPRHMEITNDRITSVEVTLRGAAFSNIWINRSLPTCVVNLQDAKEGDHVVTLTPANVKTPRGSGIEVLQINPARVELRLEQTVSKEVPILAPIIGEPSRDFEIYGKSVKPDTVVVTGPRSRIEPLEEMSTEAVSIRGQKQSTRFFVQLQPKGSFVRTSLTTPVQVDIQIGPRRHLFTVDKVPVAAEDTSYITVPRQVAVQVMAPLEMKQILTPSHFSVTIPIKGMDEAKLPARIKPEVRLLGIAGDTILIKGTTPPEVTVRRR